MAHGSSTCDLVTLTSGHSRILLGGGEMVRGLPEIENVEQLCFGCLIGKQRRAPFPRQVEYRAEEVLELVHGDICRPISPTTPSDNRYFIFLEDDASRFMWLKVLKTKDVAVEAIKHY
jgi:hypothetical protein